MPSAKRSEPLPRAVHPQDDSIPSLPIVSTQEPLSATDKLVLYLFLQDIAQELRRIRHERQKNQQAS